MFTSTATARTAIVKNTGVAAEAGVLRLSISSSSSGTSVGVSVGTSVTGCGMVTGTSCSAVTTGDGSSTVTPVTSKPVSMSAAAAVFYKHRNLA